MARQKADKPQPERSKNTNATPEATGIQQGRGDIATRFQPGQSGNPAGRPKGSRQRLAESFVKALAEDFERDGIEAIKKVRADKPGEYLRVIAAVLPKQLEAEDEDGNVVGVAAITMDALARLMERN